MNLQITRNKEALSESVAEWMCNKIATTLRDQEYFTLVLSGGSTPVTLYKLLATPKYKDRIEWKRIHIFWGDERVVPYADDRNNARMACDILLDKVPVQQEHIHIMRTDIEPNFSVDAYENKLHDFFDNTHTTFDLVLLGMGDDGHTLSLFPESSILEDHEHWVTAVYVKKLEMYRITLMPAIINRAANILFMVSGKGKAKTLREVVQGPYEPHRLPSQLIKAEKGELLWFVDEDAASDIQST